MRNYIENACQVANIKFEIIYIKPEQFAIPKERERIVGEILSLMDDGRLVWINEEDETREQMKYDQGIKKRDFIKIGDTFYLKTKYKPKDLPVKYSTITKYDYDIDVDLRSTRKKGGITFNCNDGLACLLGMTAGHLTNPEEVSVTLYMDRFGILPKDFLVQHDTTIKEDMDRVKEERKGPPQGKPEDIIAIVKNANKIETQTIVSMDNIAESLLTAKQSNSRGGLGIKAIWGARTAHYGVRTRIASGLIGMHDHKNFISERDPVFYPILADIDNLFPSTNFLPPWHPLYPGDV
jgi:hypothetical protein